PIGIMSLNQKTLRLGWFERAVAGEHFNLCRVELIRRRSRCARSNPIEQSLVIARAGSKALSAFMRRLSERLENDQAFVGEGVIDSARMQLRSQPSIIPLWRE